MDDRQIVNNNANDKRFAIAAITWNESDKHFFGFVADASLIDILVLNAVNLDNIQAPIKGKI